MLASAQQNDDLDRGPSAASKERFCALTRIARPVDDLIRFVVGPAGEAVPDLKRKLPGRGLWLTATREAIDEAVKRKVFARGFKRDVTVPADLAATTEALLARAALDALAIAGKAGQVVNGFAKVEAAIAQGDAIAVLHASDGSEDGLRKIEGALRREQAKTPKDVPVIAVFSGNQLDLALNRLNVVHAALLAGPVSDTFIARSKRFERFRTGILTNTTPGTDATTATADVKAD
ncbi:MAG: RNA-binding protein [Pseudolabrys sp.]|nr:RNA-binding protein [Pseudolabrys sp.]